MAEKAPSETIKMQKRAVATRQRFLEATLQSLAEKGYAATTAQEVCRRLGASRGTLLHHFATREELIIEAVEYILGENVRHFKKTMADIPADGLSLADISRLLWKEHWTSNTYYAWLELVVASRTDPVLNKQVRSLSERWTEKFHAAFREVMGYEPEGVFWLFFLMLNALSIEIIHTTPERVNSALNDLLAFVDISDRFFIRFGKQREKSSEKKTATGTD
ncbi:MAG: TetR/AcrR family transcriptional regulator [Thermodesulfobacteriota bacterium]